MQLQEDIVTIVWGVGGLSEEVTLETTAIIEVDETVEQQDGVVAQVEAVVEEEVVVVEAEAAVEEEVVVEAEGVNNGNEN
jgi:hypothetical protein